MVFKNDFVLAILSQGKVLREFKNNVYLPFGSDYTIRFKNKSLSRVGIKVSVDGTLIHPQDVNLIVDSGDTLDLKRMMVDGDLDRGPKLKFVEASHPEVSDPTNRDNGLVEIEVYREAWVMYSTPIVPVIYSTYSVDYTCSTNRLYNTTDGATIPGSMTTQSFEETHVTLEKTPCTTLRLRLRGTKNSERPLFVKNTKYKYCTSCGKKCKFKDKFCPRCGKQLPKII